jgi:acetyl-CoA C-acetyltransferase
VTMGGHALAQAISRAGLESKEVQDVVFGCALPAGVTGGRSR